MINRRTGNTGNVPGRGFIAAMALFLLTPFFCPWESSGQTITDMAGRNLTLPGPAQRIITTFKPATLCLFSLGLENRIVGIDASSRQDRLHRAVMPEVSRLTSVGSKSAGLNFETMVSLTPDLVILYAQKNGLSLAKKLEKIRIPSIIILPEDFQSVERSIDLIARAAGVSGRAELVTGTMEALLFKVAERIAPLVMDQKKTGYFASPRGLFSTATGNMLQDEIFEKAGIINVAHELSGYFQDISAEQFMNWNPEMIVFSRHCSIRAIQRLKNPALQTVAAVQSGSVYQFPSNLAPWDFPSPLSALGVFWLASRAYPERFRDMETRRVVDRFHKTLFKKSFSEMGGKPSGQLF